MALIIDENTKSTQIFSYIVKAKRVMKKRGDDPGETKTDRLIKLIGIIIRNLNLNNYLFELIEWYYPRFYLEIKQQYRKYPDNVRLSLSYDVSTGTIMNEDINGIKTDNFHGCVRTGMYKLVNTIKKELDTEFHIPIRTTR